MDIKEQIKTTVEKIMKDEKLMAQFKTDPVKAVETAAGIDLPDDVINKVIDAVKLKIGADTISNVAEGLKKLF